MGEIQATTKRFRRREVVFTPADERAFSSVLRKTFPNIRFLGDYQDVVRDFFAKDPGRKELPELPYVEDLSKVRAGWRIGWLEPEDWVPEFTPSHHTGKIVLANAPRLAFRYFIAQRRVFQNDHSMVTTYRIKDKPLPNNRVRMPDTLHVSFLPFDDDARKFAARIMRLVSKVAVNTLIRVDSITGYSWMPPARERDVWVGHDALAWCRKSPRNFADINLRPGDEAEERHKLPKDDPDFYSLEEASERMHADYSRYITNLQSAKK